MKRLSRFLIGMGALLMSAPIVSAQQMVELPPNMTVADVCTLAKVRNNGKVLSEKGRKAILLSELTGMGVTKDTTYITLKEEVLKRIDKDKSNYVSKNSAKKKSGTKKKK